MKVRLPEVPRPVTAPSSLVFSSRAPTWLAGLETSRTTVVWAVAVRTVPTSPSLLITSLSGTIPSALPALIVTVQSVPVMSPIATTLAGMIVYSPLSASSRRLDSAAACRRTSSSSARRRRSSAFSAARASARFWYRLGWASADRVRPIGRVTVLTAPSTPPNASRRAPRTPDERSLER